jgi:integrase
MIDEAGLSARVGADQLGHAKVSMTQDVYMRRGRVHPPGSCAFRPIHKR